MVTKARIERIAYIGWIGIDYEELSIDPNFTGLIGNSGAGKSTLVMCLDYVLLPDRVALDVKPISEVEDPHAAGIDPLASRINRHYGYAYVVFDIRTRKGKRLVAGIHFREVNGRAELTRWTISNLDETMALQNVMRVVDGDEESYPDLADLRRALAGEGIDLVRHETVGEYGQVLYDAGVLPADLYDRHDRSLYGKLIETSFRGGITSEVARNLKGYLLTEARRIPEAVTRLQEFTDEVMRTRRTLNDAKAHLALLESTYGTGKKIVAHAMTRLFRGYADSQAEAEILRQAFKENQALSLKLENEKLRLEADIIQAKQTLQNVTEAKRLELGEADRMLEKLEEEERSKHAVFDKAADRASKLKVGERAWRNVSAGRAGMVPATAAMWLEKQIEECLGKVFEKNQKIAALNVEKSRLAVNEADPKAAALAGTLGGQTLAEALDQVNETEARNVEIALSGMTSGVVGVDAGALSKVSPSEDYPSMFWLGESPPKPATPRQIGPWLVTHGAGGYIVASNERPTVFGSGAREARTIRIGKEVATLERERDAIRENEERGLKDRRDELIRSEDAIAFYHEHHGEQLAIYEAFDKAKSELQAAKASYKEAKGKRGQLNSELLSFSEPYRVVIHNLESQFDTVVLNGKQGATEGLSLQRKLGEKEVETAQLFSHVEQAREILATDTDRMVAEGEADPAYRSDKTLFIRDQTRRISELSRALENEPLMRLSVLQSADADDLLSCIRIWPALLEILRDRIPDELLDRGGEDLLQEMRERRTGLELKLKSREDNLKNQARTVYSAIVSEISSQKRKIRTLNRYGESLEFGNVTGIRIEAEDRKELLGLLEKFSDQMAFDFSDASNEKPLTEMMSEFFEKILDRKMAGEELLDYRTYMDIRIAARRRGQPDWAAASSLSGGESIGCGLSISLMLFRSLAERGEIRLEEITPLFAIDEVQRLDADGQKVIAEFCEREGVQVIVTAPTLEPKYRCTLYALARVYDPEARLIVRGIRGFLTDEDAPVQAAL